MGGCRWRALSVVLAGLHAAFRQDWGLRAHLPRQGHQRLARVGTHYHAACRYPLSNDMRWTHVPAFIDHMAGISSVNARRKNAVTVRTSGRRDGGSKAAQ